MELIRSQGKAGFAMKDFGRKLQASSFEASVLNGYVRVEVDGLQRLRRAEVDRKAVEAAGGREELADALLGALQTAHDKSYLGTKGDVWQMYRTNPSLMQAPLTQIGVGDTAEDPWEHVVADEASIAMATELFERFDVDRDAYWNLAETSEVQLATEGAEMNDEAFNALLIAAAPNGGRDLTEEDLTLGLSKAEVIELYTDSNRQRKLGFVLDVRRDHAAVFKTDSGLEAPSVSPEPRSTKSSLTMVD